MSRKRRVSFALAAALSVLSHLSAYAGDEQDAAANAAQATADRTQAQVDKITHDFQVRTQQCAEAQKRLTPLSHAARLHAIAHLPSGIYVNLPEFWQFVQTTDMLFDAYQIFPEPLSADAINAAERLLPQTQGDDRFRLAIMLYRYNRSQGAQALRTNVIKRSDAKSAAVLAANHDRSALPEMLTLLKTSPDSSWLIAPLSTWRDDQVQKALLIAYQAHPNDVGLATALALQKYTPALPALESAYHHVRGYPVGNTIVYGSNKTILGATLISLGSKEGPALISEYQKELDDSLHSQTMEMNALTLINIIGQLKLREFTPNLEAILQAYVTQSKSDHKQWSEVFAVSAAKSLYRIDPVRTAPEIPQLKRALKAKGAEAGDWENSLQFDLSEIDDSTLEPENYLRLKGVRPIPRELLPTIRKIVIL